eukprot:1006722-Prorocentrum_minimum.AAC.1
MLSSRRPLKTSSAARWRRNTLAGLKGYDNNTGTRLDKGWHSVSQVDDATVEEILRESNGGAGLGMTPKQDSSMPPQFLTVSFVQCAGCRAPLLVVCGSNCAALARIDDVKKRAELKQSVEDSGFNATVKQDAQVHSGPQETPKMFEIPKIPKIPQKNPKRRTIPNK